MKTLDKIGLIVFSDLILILSIIICLMVFGWLSVEDVYFTIKAVLADQTSANIILGISIACILLAIKCVFFTSEDKRINGIKDGILLKNDDGELVISKTTLEELVNNITKGFESAQNVSSKIVLDKEKKLYVYVTISVTENAIIKELTTNIQNKVKTAIKKTVDLEVKEVNVSVRNLQVEQSK